MDEFNSDPAEYSSGYEFVDYDVEGEYDEIWDNYHQDLSHTFEDVSRDDESQNQHLSPPPEIADDDNSIVFSTSLNQSREFIQNNLGIPSSSLRNSGICGLIVLRLEDFALLRNDSRCKRTTPHFLILPNEGFELNHSDFSTCLAHFY